MMTTPVVVAAVKVAATAETVSMMTTARRVAALSNRTAALIRVTATEAHPRTMAVHPAMAAARQVTADVPPATAAAPVDRRTAMAAGSAIMTVTRAPRVKVGATANNAEIT